MLVSKYKQHDYHFFVLGTKFSQLKISKTLTRAAFLGQQTDFAIALLSHCIIRNKKYAYHSVDFCSANETVTISPATAIEFVRSVRTVLFTVACGICIHDTSSITAIVSRKTSCEREQLAQNSSKSALSIC